MSFYHQCIECRICMKCCNTFCKTTIPPIKEAIEDGYIVRRCPNCDNIIEKYETLETLSKRRLSSNER